MNRASSDIVALVREIVDPLVEDKEAVEVTSSFSEDGTERVEIRVAADDAGKVIGRRGRTIKAIRTIARALGQRVGTSVDVEVLG